MIRDALLALAVATSVVLIAHFLVWAITTAPTPEAETMDAAEPGSGP